MVHMAGLTDSNKSNGRESVLDLRTKPSFHQPQLSQHPDRSPVSDSPGNGFQKKSHSVPSLLDRNHSFAAFASPSFFGEPFSPLLPSPHAFHDFLPGSVLGHQPGGGVPLCWPSGYGHASFLPSLPFGSQFGPLAYNLAVSTESALNGESCLGHTHGQTSVSSTSASAKVQAAATAATRVKQAPRFQCPDCSRVYSTFSGLSKHRQFHCAAQLKRQFGCKFCQKHYTSLG